MSGRRLSIFLPSLAGGGAERAVATLAGGLAARGVAVALVLGQAQGPYLVDLHPSIQLVDLRVTSMWRALPKLAAHLRQTRPDALLSAMSHANVVAALAHRIAASKARLVLSERVHLGAMFEEYRDLRTRATHALMRLTYPWANCIVTVSEGVADDLIRHVGIPAAHVKPIYNPVVDEQLLAQAAQTPSHPWLVGGDVPVVLGAGRLIGQKDFAMLIDAFALLRMRRKLRLIILGEGELRPKLQEQARRLGLADCVDLPGFETNPFASMRTAAVFVLSSRFEGLPGVLIQAMACGVRVVSTDCPSGPSEILQGGKWGRLTSVGDPAALAAAIEGALDDPSPPDVRQRAADFSTEAAIARYAQELGLC